MKKQKLAVLVAAVLWGVASGASALTSSPTDSVKGRAPEFASASFSYDDVNSNGLVDVGDILTITANGFSDPDLDGRAADKFTWYRDSNPIPGEDTDTYTLTEADFGAVITAGVMPQTDADITDPYQGLEMPASSGSPDGDGTVEVVKAKEVSAIEIVDNLGTVIIGRPTVGDVLTAKVTTSDGAVGNEADYEYKWMIEDPVSGNYDYIPTETNATYTVRKEDQKRKLRVEVTLKP